MPVKINNTEDEWKEKLTPAEYRILRQKGTEQPFTGAFWDHHESGTYHCAACGEPLFRSDAKYDSGTGWPSFWKPAASDAVIEREDHTHSLRRTEVICSSCNSHLGHVFPDGPRPTGLRYCINSASLSFRTRSDDSETTS